MDYRSCTCNATAAGDCPTHGFDRIAYDPRDLVPELWEDRFIKELMRQNKIRAKEEVRNKSFAHSEEVRVKMRANT